MKPVTGYRGPGRKRAKSLIVTAILILTAFMAGAAAERSAHFLQDIMSLVPVAQESLTTFFRERVIFKITALIDCLKWTGVIIVSVF
ncbi:MAG: hypothetical protein K6U74_00575 [Firmicutes bacterium]|nr:hypothetical protein [Bacillota bacterium]